jgi:ATP-dependent 26S proteasome regulatory subunit
MNLVLAQYIYNELANIVRITRQMCSRNTVVLEDTVDQPQKTAVDIIIENREKLQQAVLNGDISYVQNASQLQDLDNLCLVATEKGYKNMVEHFISKGATNLNQCLSVACKNDKYEVAEFLVQKGASPLIGLRVSKSPNITRMLYRYDQKTENT